MLLLTRDMLVVNWRQLYYKCDLPQPVSTVDPEYTLVAIILFVVQTLVFIPRIATRLFGLGQWYKDDTSCVAAYVSFAVILDSYLPIYADILNRFFSLRNSFSAFSVSLLYVTWSHLPTH